MHMPDPSMKHLAHLARIALSPEEEARVAREFADVIAYVGKVQGSPGVERPLTATITGVQQVLRDDAVSPSALTEQLLRQAPATEREHVKVPGIL
jgi:aspartyl-tRNA(Asn)/glutamyl-tRNA(Gln) amidotransferase subunit C